MICNLPTSGQPGQEFFAESWPVGDDAAMARQIQWRGALSADGAGDGRRPERPVWRPGSPVVPPRSIVEASRVMQFAGVLSLLEIGRAFLTRNDLRAAFAGESRAQG